MKTNTVILPFSATHATIIASCWVKRTLMKKKNTFILFFDIHVYILGDRKKKEKMLLYFNLNLVKLK